MPLDIITLVLLIVFFVRGFMKGIIVAAFSVISILLGLLVALKLSQAFASWLLAHDYVSSGWAQVIAYIVLFIGVVMLVRLIARMIEKAAEGLMLGTINKLLGALLYVFLGAVIWSSLLWLGASAQIIPAQTIAESRSYGMLSGLAPWFFGIAGHLLPFVQDTFANLSQFFDTVNAQPADVGTH